MSYHIGQHTYSKNINDYLENTQINDNDLEQKETSLSGNSLKFIDWYINPSSLTSNNSYYLCFRVKKRSSINENEENNNNDQLISNSDSGDQNIHLKLQHSDGSNTNEQILKKYFISGTNSEEDEYEFFEIVFTPNTEYDRITWELQRTGIDYIRDQTSDNNTCGRLAEIIDVGLFKIKNKKDNNAQELTKIGIQGPPSLLICINGQQIRLGRNGIYEINGGIPINFVGFVPNGSYFFMDYEYEN